MLTPATYDVRRLGAQLRSEVRGTVHDDASARALYATDASNYRVVPDLVVVPRDVDDLAAAVALTAAAGWVMGTIPVVTAISALRARAAQSSQGCQLFDWRSIKSSGASAR